MTDPNNAQPRWQGVIKRATGGSLARSWPPPLPRRRCCCVLCCYCCWACLLLLRICRCCPVVASAVCSVLETLVYFTCAHSTPRALAYVNAQPPRHGVIERTIGGSRHAGNALGRFGPGCRRGCVRQGALECTRGESGRLGRAGPSSARNERKRLGEPVLLAFSCGIPERVRERTIRTLILTNSNTY